MDNVHKQEDGFIYKILQTRFQWVNTPFKFRTPTH